MAANSMESKALKCLEVAPGTRTTGAWCDPQYSFIWTENHLSRSVIHPLRQQSDELGVRVLERLQNIIKTSQEKDGGRTTRLDLFATLRDNHETDPVLSAFWKEVNTVPEWVQWDQIHRAQPFFYRYAVANIVGFALQGFFGENSGVKSVTEVLARTGGFRTPVLFRRLMETLSWLLQITDNVTSIQPGGDAWISTVRVRLLHASVRQRILGLVETRPEYFDVEELGIPVSTLDSIHSITTFACNPLFLQLPRMGIKTSRQEMDDYIALFRYIAYLLGTPQQYVESTAQARATMESMMVHELTKPTETSKNIASNLMAAIEDFPPLNISRRFFEAGARRLNGNTFCDALDLGRPSWSSYAAWHVFCGIISGLAMLQRICPPLDRYMVQTFHDSLHDAVIHGKHGIKSSFKFHFQHVPRMDSVTVVREGGGRVLKARKVKRPLEAGLVGLFVVVYCVLLPAIVLWCLSAFGFGFYKVPHPRL